MRYDWLLDLVALLDTGSVSNAAAKRNISQSAFSRRIKMLEGALGLDIIDRRSKPNLPSLPLQTHGEEIRQLVNMQNHLIRQIQIEASTGSKHIVIAAQQAITTSLGHTIVKKVASVENTHVRLRSANLDECEALLLTGQADFIMNYITERNSGKPKSEFAEQVIMENDKLVPVFASAHVNRLLWQFHKGQLDTVTYPSDIFFGMEFDYHILPGLEKKCRINTVVETALSPAALQLASASVGVAWVPRALAREKLDDRTLTDLSEHLGSVDMKIVARRLPGKGNNVTSEIWDRLIFADTKIH